MAQKKKLKEKAKKEAEAKAKADAEAAGGSVATEEKPADKGKKGKKGKPINAAAALILEKKRLQEEAQAELDA